MTFGQKLIVLGMGILLIGVACAVVTLMFILIFKDAAC